ncbi:LysR family transcriptional regulator [Chitinivorax sp. B]|uniref:LysR family transcriptional regulator n=1 Tax=Chitinivorax sp. B TaxID=2502235 RepID=UPI0010F81315|nr:LysR family transcriptional regulator [Chitinivorax sp. B]
MKNTNSLDWNDLKYFLAVARGNGLTAAAERLGSSASTVSRHINAMEAKLGMRLFLRQQSGYQLTDQGSSLFIHVAEVERAMQAVERQSGLTAKEEAVGLVRLATSEMLASALIAPHLGEFVQRHPKVQIELIASRTLADLTKREADLALRIAAPNGDSHHPDYIAHHLGGMTFGLYCAPMLLEQAANGDWHTLPFISWDESWMHDPRGQWLNRIFSGKTPILQANSMQAQYAAACTGLGVVILPRYMGDSAPSLQRLDAPDIQMERALWLVYHRDLKGSQRVLAMRDFVMALVKRLVY